MDENSLEKLKPNRSDISRPSFWLGRRKWTLVTRVVMLINEAILDHGINYAVAAKRGTCQTNSQSYRFRTSSMRHAKLLGGGSIRQIGTFLIFGQGAFNSSVARRTRKP